MVSACTCIGSAYLAGVDISRKMVHKAAERNIYDHLITGDMTQTLAEFASDPFDLIISADVLVYVCSNNEGWPGWL